MLRPGESAVGIKLAAFWMAPTVGVASTGAVTVRVTVTV
jgi:hypothetical protein